MSAIKSPLRIAVLASNLIRIPPRPSDVPAGFSGAAEMIVHMITEELVRRGHRVTIFASGDSKTSAELVSVTRKATSKDPAIWSADKKYHLQYELLLAEKLYEMASAGSFDIIHSHLDIAALYFARFVSVPTVTTVHSRLTGMRFEMMKALGGNQHFVSISDSQRKPLPRIPWAATIYHGIDYEHIPYRAYPSGDYAVIAGRINEQKGIHEAIRAAKGAHIKLVILGSHAQDNYWLTKVKPYIDGKMVIYKDFVPRRELFHIIGRAGVFLAPLQWEEPFGLMMAESMAAGTPVIAFRRGSMPEVIVDGKTGFLVNTVSEMARAIQRVGTISRADCRGHVEEHFSISRMIDRYEETFYSLCERAGRGHSHPAIPNSFQPQAG